MKIEISNAFQGVQSCGSGVVKSLIISLFSGFFVSNIVFAEPTSIQGEFISQTGLSATVFENAGSIDFVSGLFQGNNAYSPNRYVYGGAIGNSGTIGSMTADFIGNYGLSEGGHGNGGAIDNVGIIGDITGIRQDNNHGKENNQTFHSLPYAKIYQQLEYKLKLLGVTLYKQNESYSSQCSPNTPDVCKEFAVKANRNPHGLYKDGNFIYNADAVGAYNIIRLYAKENSKQITLPKVMISNPFTVNVYKH
jgi:putative transposase